MRSNDPEHFRLMTQLLDEIIPSVPVDDRMPALIERIRECILKAVAEGNASYESLLAVASTEMGVMQARVLATDSDLDKAALR